MIMRLTLVLKFVIIILMIYLCRSITIETSALHEIFSQDGQDFLTFFLFDTTWHIL